MEYGPRLRSLGDGDVDLVFERIERHETALSERFLAGLPEDLRLYGIAGSAGRTPTARGAGRLTPLSAA